MIDNGIYDENMAASKSLLELKQRISNSVHEAINCYFTEKDPTKCDCCPNLEMCNWIGEQLSPEDLSKF